MLRWSLCGLCWGQLWSIVLGSGWGSVMVGHRAGAAYFLLEDSVGQKRRGMSAWLYQGQPLDEAQVISSCGFLRSTEWGWCLFLALYIHVPHCGH